MRKVSLILAVLMLAAPAWAASNVTITAVPVGSGNEVAINYTSDVNLPRAFGLDITVTEGNIVGIKDYFIGECNDIAQGYGIFLGTIAIESDGEVTDYGSPVSPNTLPDTLPGVNHPGITIEMGSLYEDGNAPPLSGTLCVITVSEECTVNIAGNAARTGTNSLSDGVVMEDPDEDPNVTFVSGGAVFCLIGGNAGPSEYSDWEDWDKPACWCYKRQCRADADGKKEYGTYPVLINDLNALAAAVAKTDAELALVPNGICADFDHKKEYGTYRVLIKDLSILATYVAVNPGSDPNDILPCDQADPNNPVYPGVVYTGPCNFWTN